MLAGSSAWFPVATLLIGFATGSLADWLKDRRSERRETTARKNEREQARLTRIHEFQRVTLLELQQVIADLARAAGKAHHHDTMDYRRSGVWGRSLFPDGDSERFREMQVKAAILAARVIDPTIREYVGQLKDACADGTMADSEATAGRAMVRMSKSLDEANQRIGEALRVIDGGPVVASPGG